MRLLFFALSTLIIVCGAGAAIYDDQNGRTALSFLDQLVDAALPIGGRLVESGWSQLWKLGVTFLIFPILLLAFNFRRREARLIALLTAGSVAAQLLFVYQFPSYGLVAAAATITIGALQIFKPAPMEASAPARFDRRDLVVGLLIVLVAAFFRFYALNRVPANFEGELSPYMMAATNLRGIFYGNEGARGPWAPLGLLYYLPIYLVYQVAGPTLLTVRLASAVVSIGTVALFYLVTRTFYPRGAAAAGGALLAFELLQIGWGRSDIHPHGSTTWPALIILYFTLRGLTAVGGSGIKYWLFLIPAAALSWHQYPSGQVAALLPAASLLYSYLAGRREAKLGLKILCCIAATIVWALSGPMTSYFVSGEFEPLTYFRKLGPRVLIQDNQQAEHSKLYRIWDNSKALLSGVLYRAPYLHNQDVVPHIPPFNTRTSLWLTAAGALLFLSLFFPRARDPLWFAPLIWCLLSFLPSVFSDLGVPKRASNAYPALCLLAGIGYERFFSATSRFSPKLYRLLNLSILIAFILATIIWCHIWFSGKIFSRGENCDELALRQFAEFAGPDAMIVLKIHGYMEGKTFYLLKDYFSRNYRRPVYLFREMDLLWEDILDDPLLALKYLGSEYQLEWLNLDRYLEGWSKSCPSEAAFLVEIRSNAPPGEKALDRRSAATMLEKLGPDAQVLNLPQCAETTFAVGKKTTRGCS